MMSAKGFEPLRAKPMRNLSIVMIEKLFEESLESHAITTRPN